MKHLAKYSRWLSGAALLLACACSPQHAATSNDTGTIRETAQLAPSIDRYKKSQAVTGFDIKANSLVVYVDSEKLSELDDETETQMKDGLLKAWAQTWSANHANRHATLRVVFQNYYGQEITTLTKRV